MSGASLTDGKNTDETRLRCRFGAEYVRAVREWFPAIRASYLDPISFVSLLEKPFGESTGLSVVG